MHAIIWLLGGTRSWGGHGYLALDLGLSTTSQHTHNHRVLILPFWHHMDGGCMLLRLQLF